MEQEKEPQPNRENPTTDHTPLTFYCCFYPPVQPGVGKKPAVCNQNENVIIPLDCSTHSPLEPSDCREDDGKWAGGCCFILTTVRNRNIALQGWVTLNILILSVLWQETPHGENLPADLDGTTVKWKPQKVIWRGHTEGSYKTTPHVTPSISPAAPRWPAAACWVSTWTPAWRWSCSSRWWGWSRWPAARGLRSWTPGTTGWPSVCPQMCTWLKK